MKPLSTFKPFGTTVFKPHIHLRSAAGNSDDSMFQNFNSDKKIKMSGCCLLYLIFIMTVAPIVRRTNGGDTCWLQCFVVTYISYRWRHHIVTICSDIANRWLCSRYHVPCETSVISWGLHLCCRRLMMNYWSLCKVRITTDADQS